MERREREPLEADPWTVRPLWRLVRWHPDFADERWSDPERGALGLVAAVPRSEYRSRKGEAAQEVLMTLVGLLALVWALCALPVVIALSVDGDLRGYPFAILGALALAPSGAALAVAIAGCFTFSTTPERRLRDVAPAWLALRMALPVVPAVGVVAFFNFLGE
jgi:hypothetical protein